MDRSGFLPFLLVFTLFFSLPPSTVQSKRNQRNSRSISYLEGVECTKPETPKFSRLKCRKFGAEVLLCDVVCKPGYVHDNGKKSEKFSCYLLEGGWDTFPLPGCHKPCDPPCENEGKCVDENHCVCTADYRGKTCQYRKSLCDPKTTLEFSGQANCTHGPNKTSCKLSCPDGTHFTGSLTEVYECSLDGIWSPPTIPTCESIDMVYVASRTMDQLNDATIASVTPQRSSGECVTWGQYHYRTFDGRIYSVNGPCTYLLAKDCSGESFNIHINPNPECGENTQCSRRISIFIGDEEYHIEEENGEVVVKLGEEIVDIPGKAGELELQRASHYLLVTSSLGFRLKWDGKQTVILSVEENMKNKTCGLCGQYDGIASNDFHMLGGGTADQVLNFVESWKMPKFEETCSQSPHSIHGCSYAKIQENTTAEAAEKACYAIYDAKYNDCHEILDPNPYYSACKTEYCECLEKDESCICDTFAEYFRECYRLGGKIHGGWRTLDVCPLDCPTGMEYMDCGTSCPKTCKLTEYECSSEHCIDGCHCSAGMFLHNGECVSEHQCPCVHGDKEYASGATIIDDCNQCECIGSKWVCTEKICNARCTSTGDSHYKTFDGYKYQFKGLCSYYLVFHNNFTIIQDNSGCNNFGLNKKESSCIKSIIVDAGSTNIVFNHGMKVSVNDQDIDKFPFTNKDVKLHETSSAFVLHIINGVSLTWDGKNNIYIDAPASLSGTLQGLCGTFNHNTKDEFSTPDGAIEAVVDDFVEKWKPDAKCKEEVSSIQQEHPCEAYKEKDEDSRRLCSMFKSEVFKDCHHEEDYNEFYKDCLYDMCSCNEKVENCLCPVFSNYAAACAKKGLIIFWREKIKECKMNCTGGQTYQECSNPCTYSCKSLSDEKCDKNCVEGCSCPEGETLSSFGLCIPISDCPCVYKKEEYKPGATENINGFYPCKCTNGQWDCSSSDIRSEDKMLQLQAETCDPEKNMVYNECVHCPKTCQNYLISSKCKMSECRSGCSCKDGYVLDTDTSVCVKVENCGCWHGGKRYPDGGSHKRDCNTCTCSEGKWVCEYNECPSVCSTWGNSHFKSFDGHYFDFQGACEYIMVKGESNSGTFFQIVIDMKICGTSGVTCAKAVKLQIGNDVKLTLSKVEELPKPSYQSPVVVRKIGLYIFVDTKIGVVFQWDRGTRISVRVEPKWKGMLSGLCGNFNDDQADDFRTPSSGPVEAMPSAFGDSWKLNEACPFHEDVNDTCEIFHHRHAWAMKQCSVIKSHLFEPCHKYVPFEPFYERCIFDTCGCDIGGDCECFCTALAAYGEACSISGIELLWRSQDLCPLQCKECDRYTSCMSTCPKETCETKFMYDDIKKTCEYEPCVEGCDPKPCPNGQIFNNDRDFKCIPEIDCEVPCIEMSGRLYVEGERILDQNVVDPCQICHCQRGKISCSGEPCRNVIQEHCKSTGWSEWMNSPSVSTGDYEHLNDPSLQKVYLKYCTSNFISAIECRTTHSLIPYQETEEQVSCKLPEGLICNDKDQRYGRCSDYEVRVLCQCEATTVSSPIETTMGPSAEIKCTAPGWTYWMNANVPTKFREEEIVTKLRKYYTFCPEEEIEKAECRVSSTKQSYEFEGKYIRCTKEGMECFSGPSGERCPDYEIRFYCRCENTECAYPRGMEKGYIDDSQINVKSYLKSDTQGYHARLNGPQAWTAKTDSTYQWIEVDLGEIQEITAVVTQGNPNALQWVERYRVFYSNDGLDYNNIYDSFGNEMIFNGNYDQDTAVTNFLPSPVRTRYVRIYPFEWHGAVSLRFELLGCNILVSGEASTTTAPSCVPGWTEFFNTDSPDFENGDYEKVESIVKTFGVCDGGEITDIECKALVDGAKVDYTASGDFGVICKTSTGVYCNNFQQRKSGKCKDYVIRLYCTCEQGFTVTSTPLVTVIPPIPQECGWTDWINIDKPRSFVADNGDMESMETLQKYYGLCQKPDLKYIECRMALTQHDWTVSPQNELVCNTDVGFKCYNRLQAGDCYDYEIRAYCLYSWCEKPTFVPTVTSTISSTPTSNPCPPGQYYDECAYTCNQTCIGYLNKLHLVGQCQENHCISSCRPYVKCEYPLLWKDPYTCVKKSECSCTTINGEDVLPGAVITTECEKCQCYDNRLNCVTIPECISTPMVGNRSFTTTSSHVSTTTMSTIGFTSTSEGFCPDETTMKEYDIVLSQISVSSQGTLSGKNRIHLHTISSNSGTGAWSPKVSDKNQYVEIDFGVPRYVAAIKTQGENGAENWVTNYSVAYSLDGGVWNYVTEGHQPKIFTGNYDSDTVVTNYFKNIIQARYIRIIPIDWHNWIAMRIGAIGCFPSGEATTVSSEILGSTLSWTPKECLNPMLHSDLEVPTTLITVSSVESEFSGANRIYLETVGGIEGTGGWKADVNDRNPFILIMFQEDRNLSGIITQGQEDEDNWVISYLVSYSTDNIIWHRVENERTGQMFTGNNDRNSLSYQWFKNIIVARYLKIVPLTTFHGVIAMRLEILGCYEPPGKFTETTTPPSAAYCPELPEISRDNCPHCTSGLVCDGSTCIRPEDCPCYMEGRKHRVGSKFETSDCLECTCRMHGGFFCDAKECPPCPEDQKSVLTTGCSCKCEGCPDGTIHCPSDHRCIEEYKWCDGKVDCIDDEQDCETTTTTMIIPSTRGPKICRPPTTEIAAVCELNSIYFETFDGKEYESDICDHVLFREKTFQIFSVEIHKTCLEENGPCRRYIIINVDNFVIKIGPGSHKIEFNGIHVPETKLYLVSKRFKEFILRKEGVFLSFTSLRYGFKVIWDPNDNVKIQIPECLLNEVNGLCGFYDGIDGNDFQKPDGTTTQTVQSFTESWSIGPRYRCVEFSCDRYLRLAAEKICSSIENPIFKDCRGRLDMERQREICVTSACECLTRNNTATYCTCEVLENFLQFCEWNIETANNNWRVDFNCVPKCPPGLEWKDCSTGCESTCDNFQEKNLGCSKKCTPGCFCPSGLVRDGDRCVDAQFCQDCVCIGYGDPNYLTFDEQSYAFQGACTYVLVRHRKSNFDPHPDFEILVTNTECPEEPGTTCTTGLQIFHDGNIVIIERNQPVKFNQEVLDAISFSFYQNGINITATKENVMVYIEEIHLTVHYLAPNFGFTIKLPSKFYYNETAGLCGVCNFEESDDLYHRDGYITEDINDFAFSWLVNGSEEKCKLIERRPTPPPTDICKWKENECDIFVDPSPYIKACQNDVSYSNNFNYSVCHTVLQYAQSCCENGVILGEWMKSFGCEFPCPDGLVFQCKSPCQLACDNYESDETACKVSNQYMCSCPKNKVIKDGECVDLIYCESCDEEGHRVGEHWDVDLCRSCECLPNFKVNCYDAICPTMPACPTGTSLEVIANGTCCDQYDCIERKIPCPTAAIPTCQTGAVPHLVTVNECQEYQCECDIDLCIPLKNISHLEPGEEIFTEENGCCLEQVIKCVSEKCPSPKLCNIGSELIEIEGNCCTLYDCMSLEKCVYKHNFEPSESFSTTLSDEYTKLYEVGETWNDGPCKKCICENVSDQFIYSCELEKCVAPSYFINKTEYVYEEQPAPGSCCPNYVLTACLADGKAYQVGSKWPSNDNDRCISFECVKGENGDVQKVQHILTCNKTCAPYAKYIEPSSESLECCGYCEPFACEDRGKIYQIGEKWAPNSDNCVSVECVKQDGKIEKIRMGKQCPLIPSDCPMEHRIMDESGCCELCEIIPGACEAKSVPPEKSIHYFYLHDKVKGVCSNKEPIQNLAECSGRCQSQTVYSPSLDAFATTCKCCTPLESAIRPITLHCKDNSTIVKEYRQPKNCECSSCSGEKEPDNTLEVPAPVK